MAESNRVELWDEGESLFHFCRNLEQAAPLPRVPISLVGDDDPISTIREKIGQLTDLWRTASLGLSEGERPLCLLCGKGDLAPAWGRWLGSIVSNLPHRCSSCGETFRADEVALIKARAITRKTFPVHERLRFMREEFEDIVRGGFSRGLVNVVAGPEPKLVFSYGEFIRFAAPAVLLKETTVRHTRSRQTSSPTRTYVGTSIRLGKGSSFWLGKSYAAPRETESVSYSVRRNSGGDSGTVAITNERIVFVGEAMDGVSVPLNQIAAIQRIDWGLMLIRRDRATPLRFRFVDVAFDMGGPIRLIDLSYPMGATGLLSMDQVIAVINGGGTT